MLEIGLGFLCGFLISTLILTNIESYRTDKKDAEARKRAIKEAEEFNQKQMQARK